MQYRYTVVAFFFGCLPIVLLLLQSAHLTRQDVALGPPILLSAVLAVLLGLAAAWYESPKVAVFAVLIGLSDFVLLLAA